MSTKVVVATDRTPQQGLFATYGQLSHLPKRQTVDYLLLVSSLPCYPGTWRSTSRYHAGCILLLDSHDILLDLTLPWWSKMIA